MLLFLSCLVLIKIRSRMVVRPESDFKLIVAESGYPRQTTRVLSGASPSRGYLPLALALLVLDVDVVPEHNTQITLFVLHHL